ncbi:UNVERIFIED_CONTAM: hypothetical protein Slati_1250400 [Sesamum latifolium]|uniref:Uncharacterized protein n=1 Tax=Sesamum latifolium TaxID=2727402 RepID=A0AAW2XG26_9LAMI
MGATPPVCGQRSTLFSSNRSRPCKDGFCIGQDAARIRNTMSILASIAFGTTSLLEFRTRDTSIVILPRITTPRVLAGMDKRALSPVMRISPRARLHLEAIHSELVRPIYSIVYIRQRYINRILLLFTPVFRSPGRFSFFFLLITSLNNTNSIQQHLQCSPLRIVRRFDTRSNQITGLLPINIKKIVIGRGIDQELDNLNRRPRATGSSAVKSSGPVRATSSIDINLATPIIYFKISVLPYREAIKTGVLSSNPIFLEPKLLPYQKLTSSTSQPLSSTSHMKPAKSSVAANSSNFEQFLCKITSFSSCNPASIFKSKGLSLVLEPPHIKP